MIKLKVGDDIKCSIHSNGTQLEYNNLLIFCFLNQCRSRLHQNSCSTTAVNGGKRNEQNSNYIFIIKNGCGSSLQQFFTSHRAGTDVERTDQLQIPEINALSVCNFKYTPLLLIKSCL